tara:strand:- start:2014 stop:2991 length:978 start_codon:yes stop_codon:yes gene_type:complete
MTLVSIIIPFKNPGQFFAPCLKSIQLQTHKELEILMVNDHSNEMDVELAKSFQKMDHRFHLIHSTGNGIIDALQTGLEKANGKYISRMDADDIMTNDKIKLMTNKLSNAPKKTISIGLVSYFASNKELNEGYKNYENWLNSLSINENNFKDIYKECTIPSPCWMMRKEELVVIGGFSSLSYPEDYDLAFKLFYASFNIATVKKVIHHWRDHMDRISRTSNTYQFDNFIKLKLNYLLKNELKETELVLWGAGNKGKRIASILNDENIDFKWISGNPNKTGHIIYRNEIKEMQYLNEKKLKLVICAISQKGFVCPENTKFNRYISFY